MSANEKMPPKFLTGGLYTTIQLFGGTHILKMIIKMALSYRKDLFFILRRQGIRVALSFIYTKIFVPCGEGAGAAFYFIGSPIIREHPRFAPFPRYVEIEHTTICDKLCIMCEHTYWKDQEERNLSFMEFKHIIDQFPALQWVHTTGEGSSFLNKDFLKMITYVKKWKRASVYFVDLFDGITEDEMRQVIEIGVNGIYLSIDGATKETYEKIRVKCNFDNVISNIKRFVELKRELKSPIPEICFRYIVLTKNLKEIPKFIELISLLGGKKTFGGGFRINFVGNLEFPEVKHLSIYTIPREIIREAVRKARELDINVIFSHTEPMRNPSIQKCHAWLEPYIMMGGYVMPCCNMMMSNKRTFLREHAFGNLFQDSFKDIWYSDRYRRFRATVNKRDAKAPLLCVGCRSFETLERIKKYGIDKDL